MQYDMHYYGTYAMACAAGITREDAQVVAYSAQNVDDQNAATMVVHDDKSATLGVATAHHPIESGIRAALKQENTANDTRLVWVPFHFLPGGSGARFEEQLACGKDSAIAREMLAHYLELPYARNGIGLQLAGIAAHVYADTFSHYDFVGVSSDFNKVDQASIEYDQAHAQTIVDYIRNKAASFADMFSGGVAEASPLGHGPVNTLPDRPFLKFRFRFQDGRESGWRDNKATFMEACERLYGFFAQFASNRYANGAITRTPFEKIKAEVEKILALEATGDARAQAWVDAMNAKKIGHVPAPTPYTLGLLDSNEDFNRAFHAAADYHRTYVLRILLPRHGIHVV